MRKRIAAALALVLVSILWWLPFSIEPPGRDQILFMAQSQALLDGSSLYTQVWEQKPPGILVAYAMAQAVAGRGYRSILLLDWLAGTLTALLLALLLWRHTESACGALGAAALGSRWDRWLQGFIRRQRYPVEDYRLGVFHYLCGDWSRFAWHMAAALRQSHGAHAELYRNLGAALEVTGNLETARRCYSIALDELPLYSIRTKQQLAQAIAGIDRASMQHFP